MSQSNGRIRLDHGAGGRAMRELVHDLFVKDFRAPIGQEGAITLAAMDDGAALRVGDQWLVLTTDSHVVEPRIFPGGDLGRLAVAGTVNDLAMMGATRALALTCAAIVEEGFSRAELACLWESVRSTCEEAGTTIVTGDTKVMRHGEVDGLLLNTTGIGLTRRIVSDAGLRPGDDIVVTGTIGDHGLAILAARNNLGWSEELRSDVAPINALIEQALEAGKGAVSALKDPTRGGVTSALTEMAEKAKVGIILEEPRIPVSPATRAIAELVGIDPLHVANEGKAVIGVHPSATPRVLKALHAHPLGKAAALIGRCVEGPVGQVVVDTGFGQRLLIEPDGEPLPRIC